MKTKITPHGPASQCFSMTLKEQDFFLFLGVIYFFV